MTIGLQCMHIAHVLAGGVIGDRATANGCCLMLSSLASTISLCPHNHIVKHQLPPKLIAGDDSSLPDDHQTVLNHLAPMLLNANRAIQIAAYRLLLRLINMQIYLKLDLYFMRLYFCIVSRVQKYLWMDYMI